MRPAMGVRPAMLIGGVMLAASACAPVAPTAEPDDEVDASKVVIEPAPGKARPPFRFSPEDDRFLDDVERGAFDYFWYAASPDTGMIPDRSSTSVISVAGVGFELSGLPVGVERGWVTRDQAEARALQILRALEANPDNRKAGLFYHFIDGKTAAPATGAYEHAVSTIDSALLMAGILTAASYFGGEVRVIGDRLFDAADWTFFIVTPSSPVRGKRPAAHEMGFMSLAWRPDDPGAPAGEGKLSPYYWLDSGDEHRLVYFLGACAPHAERRPHPDLYYRLRRQLGATDDGLMVWFPFSGALFTHFFAHCWIDYAAMGPDDPGAHGALQRARVDWWENGRRAALMHRAKAIRNPLGLPGFGPDAWGVTASDSPKGYAVPGLYPRPVRMLGARAEFDYSTFGAKDDFGNGAIAPYGAGSAILFEPELALRALRHYRGLTRGDGTPLVWREPVADRSGNYGFKDAFDQSADWAASDYVAIDQGPLLLCIENARTGLVCRLFHGHPWVMAGMDRLGLVRTR
jgi:hypothetical protein